MSSAKPLNPACRRCRLHPRRGAAIVVVLGIIAITMAVSYGIMRAQGTALKIQENSRRRFSARQAAVTGMMIGLRKMHLADEWGGIDTTLSGSITPWEHYTVSYLAGDALLSPGDPDFAELPYRVTLRSTGYADDEQSGGTSTHRIEAVVRLVPRGLSPLPAGWSAMQQFTVYQWDDQDFVLQLPCRIDGPVRVGGRLQLCQTYPSFPHARERYLSDLEAMRVAGQPDYRPVTGPLSWNADRQSDRTASYIDDLLNVATIEVPRGSSGSWSFPSSVENYRLYPGGKRYDIPRLGDTLEDVALGPNAETNPLGVYYRHDDLRLRDNVTIEGMLLARGSVEVEGRNVHLRVPQLLPLDSDTPVRLQALVAGNRLRVESGARGSITGAILCLDEFEIREGPESAEWDVQGSLFTRRFSLHGRREWEYDSSTWRILHDLFLYQLSSSGPKIQHFPNFMAVFGRRPQPKLLFRPNPAEGLDHWLLPEQGVYAPAAGDPGLRWDLLRWTDAPAET